MASLILAFSLFFASSHTYRISALEPDTPHLLQIPLSGTASFGQSRPLQCLEVVPPVVTPNEDIAYSQIVMRHSFGNSYGKPYIGKSTDEPVAEYGFCL
jgi:hypothetical protein